MKFSCEKALLMNAVATASRTVSPKSSIPALEGLLVEATDTLRLTGYNLETGITVTVPAEIKETGTYIFPARLFSEIIRKLPDEIVEVRVKPKSKTTMEIYFDQWIISMRLHNADTKITRTSLKFDVQIKAQPRKVMGTILPWNV